MVEKIRRVRFAVLAGAVAMTAGRVVDLRWHATHQEFETGADQLQAHWLAWVGALILSVAAVIGVSRPVYRSPGFIVLLPSGLAYIVVVVWHFWLHNQLRDPALPHVLLALSQLGLYVGTALIAAGLVVPSCRQKYVDARGSLAA